MSSPSVDGGRGATGPRRGPIPALIAILVAMVTVTSAMFWTGQEGPPGEAQAPQPKTLEGWLYDFYYNATTMGYDRDEWGGHVIWTDDPVAAVNTDPDNLTVPVFAYVPRELSDDYVKPIVAKFFPGVNASSLHTSQRMSEDGTVIEVSVGNSHGSLDISRDGEIRYNEDRSSTPGDIFRTNESAKEYAIEWLKAHDAWPSDAASVSFRCNPKWPSTGCVLYMLGASRQTLGFEHDSSIGEIRLDIEGSTGKIVTFFYFWPALLVPFVVTDLPSIDLVLERYGLTELAKNVSTVSISENLSYKRAPVIWEMGLSDTAPVYFYLPYRWMSGWPYQGPNGYLGVIFPEEALFLMGSATAH